MPMRASAPKPGTPLEAEDAYKAALLEVVKQAQFPESRQDAVLHEISGWLEVYQFGSSTPVLTSQKLKDVLDAAAKLRDRISKLDAFTQLRLGVLVHDRANPLNRIITVASSIKDTLKKGGHPGNKELNSLLICLSVLWVCEFENRRGITRSGSSRDMYRGPLLDFVEGIFNTQATTYEVLGNKSRRIQYGGRSALGKRLYGLIKNCKIGNPDPKVGPFRR
jgi:hypothetical protein